MSKYVMVNPLELEEFPNAIGFLFQAADGKPLTPQETIDALVDFFIENYQFDYTRKDSEVM